LVARLDTDGDPDDSFGGDGFVAIDFFDNHDYVYDVAAAPGDKLVAVGEAFNGGTSNYEVAVARVEDDGDLDGTFGGGDGKETYNFGDRIPQGLVYSALVRDNGKIILGIRTSGVDADYALAQLNEDGTVDEDFANDGLRLIDFKGQADSAHALAWQGNRILVAGRARNANGNAMWGLTRINSNGSLDQSFGKNGRVMTDGRTDSADEIYDLAVQGDDRIVAVGIFAFNGPMVVGRYKPDGALDSTFSGDGIKEIRFPMGVIARGVDRYENRIVVGGDMNAGADSDAIVAAVLKRN
jgi:uncharacterized delta-60 repeat protein